ncbi:hypothetical protein L9F63_012948, partial [Diploptera punctata]
TSGDKVMQDIYKQHISNHESSLPHSSLEGLRNVCARYKYAWMISPINVFTYLKELDCDLEPVFGAYIPGSASMAIQKKSPYVAILRHTLHKMHNSGILQILHRENFLQIIPESGSEIQSVNLNQVTPILVLLALGIIISALLLLTERLMSKYTR